MSVAVIAPVGATQMKLNPITDIIMKRIHQSLTTEQKIRMLTTDFLDRDQTTFVKIRRTGRLGWESAFHGGKNASCFLCFLYITTPRKSDKTFGGLVKM